jgi:DNA topoisomerase IA
MISLEDYLKQEQIDSKLLKNMGIFDEINELWQNTDFKKPKQVEALSLAVKNILLKTGQFQEEIIKKDLIGEEGEIDEEDKIEGLIFKPVLIQGEKLTDQLSSEEQVLEIGKKIQEDLMFEVVSVNTRQLNIKPKPPFTTSTLQQAASSYLGYVPKITMQLAQKLYEGVEINKENVALITYMRTDSVALSQESLTKIRNFIKKHFPQSLPKEVRLYTSKSKNAQEAHEAIRPTDPLRTPESLKNKIDNKLWKLYDLIWKQTIASQMANEIREMTTFELENKQKTRFSGSSTNTVFLGWKNVFPERHRPPQQIGFTQDEEQLKAKWLEMLDKDELV